MTNHDQEIPASRIMRERDGYKHVWAQEFTRAEALEKQLAQAIAARVAAEYARVAQEGK